MPVHEIAIRLDRIGQLYGALDPAPFHEIVEGDHFMAAGC